MSSFKIEINTDGSAFDGDDIGYEINRILDKLSKKIEYGVSPGDEFILHDVNGNRVGKAVAE